MATRSDARVSTGTQSGSPDSQLFTDALLTASRGTSSSDTANGSVSKGTSRQKTDSGDASGSTQSGSGPVANSQVHSQEPDLSQQVSTPHATPLPSPALLSPQMPISWSVHFPDVSPTITGASSQDIVATASTKQSGETSGRPTGFSGAAQMAVSNEGLSLPLKAIDSTGAQDGGKALAKGPVAAMAMSNADLSFPLKAIDSTGTQDGGKAPAKGSVAAMAMSNADLSFPLKAIDSTGTQDEGKGPAKGSVAAIAMSNADLSLPLNAIDSTGTQDGGKAPAKGAVAAMAMLNADSSLPLKAIDSTGTQDEGKAPAKGAVACEPIKDSPAEAQQQKSAPNDAVSRSSTPSPADAAAGQMATLVEENGQAFVTGSGNSGSLGSGSVVKPMASVVKQAGPIGLSDAAGAKSTSDGLAAAKQQAKPISSERGTATNPAQAQTSVDQKQDGNASQVQGAGSAQIDLGDRSGATFAHAQSSVSGSAQQPAATTAGGVGSTAKTPSNTAVSHAAEPQIAPVINSARLIQNMGQTEMRVGMRSSEFGNISISTSVTRNLISAQLSVDHSELARTIAASLPEMQARLGGSQAVAVRIDMNGAATGQGSDSFSGLAGGNSNQSREDRQQAGNPARSYAGNVSADLQIMPGAAAGATNEMRLSSRLDIRV